MPSCARSSRRYLYRVKGNWFVGAQGIYQNFAIGGETAFDDQVLDILGVRPYKSGGLGLVAYYDSRDNENMPTRGWLLNLNNMAYRESLGGEENSMSIASTSATSCRMVRATFSPFAN